MKDTAAANAWVFAAAAVFSLLLLFSPVQLSVCDSCTGENVGTRKHLGCEKEKYMNGKYG